MLETSAPEESPPVQIVVMGVSAAGKSTVGCQLAERLKVPFYDADDLHPKANVEKMRAGMPLNDQDRAPWLELVGRTLADSHTGGVIACSALKRRYRDAIREQAPATVFLHLHGTDELLRHRAEHREGHFMPPGLLISQLADLEPLEKDEPGARVDIADPPEKIVAVALQSLSHMV
ncbi:gluconokinase [Nesterenkonia rhizosphaerae]